MTQETVAARRAAVKNSKMRRDMRCAEEAEIDCLMTTKLREINQRMVVLVLLDFPIFVQGAGIYA